MKLDSDVRTNLGRLADITIDGSCIVCRKCALAMKNAVDVVIIVIHLNYTFNEDLHFADIGTLS